MNSLIESSSRLSGSPYQRRLTELLATANVRIGTDLHVHDPRFYARVWAHGTLGVGESFVDGWWDSDDLDALLLRLVESGVSQRRPTFDKLWLSLKARVLNLQQGQRALAVGERHYDLGNDLYQAMLGPNMVYSCGYWKDANDLEAAQQAKLDLVFRKLGVQRGDRVLDIGCGWGSALKRAAEHYGASGVGVTISREQAEYARTRCQGLPIDIRLTDYHSLNERFDHVFSIGMFEHVGLKNYRNYFEVARRCLRDDGLLLLHTIGANTSVTHTDPWIAKYIFPNSMIPSAAQITQALESLFVIEDWHNFGSDYAQTLAAWRDNFERAWPALSARYDERFRRMWRFYLAGAIAHFRCRRLQLWQLVLSPHGVTGGYHAVR